MVDRITTYMAHEIVRRERMEAALLEPGPRQRLMTEPERSGPSLNVVLSAFVIGIITGAEFKIQQSQLEPGDILIGYTDGVTEALSPSQTLYSKEKFRALLEVRASSATELIQRIQTDLFQHIDNAPQFDDITMIAVHRKPKQ